MNRHDFMTWAESQLARALGVAAVKREGDNNVQHVLLDPDVHIGIVATQRGRTEIRVHIWTYDANRIARWDSGKQVPGPWPIGMTLQTRAGDKTVDIRYQEFAWPNSDFAAYEQWQNRVSAFVDFFVTAARAGRIP